MTIRTKYKPHDISSVYTYAETEHLPRKNSWGFSWLEEIGYHRFFLAAFEINNTYTDTHVLACQSFRIIERDSNTSSYPDRNIRNERMFLHVREDLSIGYINETNAPFFAEITRVLREYRTRPYPDLSITDNRVAL